MFPNSNLALIEKLRFVRADILNQITLQHNADYYLYVIWLTLRR